LGDVGERGDPVGHRDADQQSVRVRLGVAADRRRRSGQFVGIVDQYVDPVAAER